MRGYPDRSKDKAIADVLAALAKADVLSVFPVTEDIAHLDRVWKLDEDSSPQLALLMWNPEDEADKAIRQYLLEFASKVVQDERRRVAALAARPSTPQSTRKTRRT